MKGKEFSVNMDTNNKNDLKNYRPMKFIDQMEKNKHILLLYEDQKYAYWIIGRYFHNGFAKGESCIFYTTDRSEIIEKQLSAEGIDVSLFKQKNQLRIYEIDISDGNNKPDMLHTLDHIREESKKRMNPPYRFVGGGAIADVETIDGMKFSISLEKTGHEHFDKSNRSQICYYDISKIEPTRKNEWISSLLRNHHYVIYASEPNKAVAFETALLEQDDSDKNKNNSQ
jgi:MEDS: MEthanogen/methylotroph, DcmR Sensory domain